MFTFYENGRSALRRNESGKWNEKEAVRTARNDLEGLHGERYADLL